MLFDLEATPSLCRVAKETLRDSLVARDKSITFCEKTWITLFSHPELTRLDFSNDKIHQKSTMSLMNGLYSIAAVSLDLPFVGSMVVQAAILPEIINKFGTPAQKKKYLPPFQSGAEIVGFCNTEASGGTYLKSMKSVCLNDGTGKGMLTASKPVATNAYGAKYILVSAWEQLVGAADKSIELYLVNAEHFAIENIIKNLETFRTGNCASVQIQDLKIDLDAARVGRLGSGTAIFKYAFDIERLYLAIIVSGVLYGIEEILFAQLKQRSHLLERQYVQEKFVRLASVRAQLDALINTVVLRGLDQISESQVELSVLKWICAEDVYATAIEAADVVGWHSLSSDSEINKVIRDLSALRYFGGTAELQKINMFSWLTRNWHKAPLKKVA